MCFFSIIIPVYNREHYISKCLDSVIKQTYLNYEIIIIDDGSSDASGKVCDRFGKKYKNIRVLHQKNAGVSKARNYGLKNANGNFVIFIDSDDYIPTDYLEKIKESIEIYGEKFFFCTAFRVYSQRGVQLFQYRKSITYSVVKENEIFELMFRGLFNSVCNKVYQTSVIRKYHIQFPEDINLGEDLIFNLKYLDRQEKLQLIVLNKVFYHVQESMVSLERGWCISYFEKQRILLDYKIKYKNKWMKEKKLCLNRSNINNIWYYMCIYESVNYYVSHMKCGRIIQICIKLIDIRYSLEYQKYSKFFNKKEYRLGRLFLHAFLQKVKTKSSILKL